MSIKLVINKNKTISGKIVTPKMSTELWLLVCLYNGVPNTVGKPSSADHVEKELHRMRKTKKCWAILA